MHSYFKAADYITFFNESDFTRAKKHANRSAFDSGNPCFKKTKERIEERVKEWKDLGDNRFKQWTDYFDHEPYFLQEKKVIFTRVPPTIGYTENITFEEFQQKKSNIVVFGMIRTCKGFEEAIDIAKTLKEKIEQGELHSLKEMKIIIIGNPMVDKTGAKLLSKLFLAKFGDIICQEVLQVHKKSLIENKVLEILDIKDGICKMKQVLLQLEQKYNTYCSIHENQSTLEDYKQKLLPIDIILSPTSEEIRTVYTENKYAVKYDNKGWANNASSHIAPLVNNCIVYTGWGINTASNVGKKEGEYSNAIQLLSLRKYGLKDGKILSLKQIYDGAKKKIFLTSGKRNTHTNRELIDANKLLNDIDSKENEDNFASMKKAFLKSLELKKQFVTSSVESNCIEQLLEEVKISGDISEISE